MHCMKVHPLPLPASHVTHSNVTVSVALAIRVRSVCNSCSHLYKFQQVDCVWMDAKLTMATATASHKMSSHTHIGDVLFSAFTQNDGPAQSERHVGHGFTPMPFISVVLAFLYAQHSSLTGI